MASWFETEKGFLFLTDGDVIAYNENRGVPKSQIDWNDYVGHDGLMKVFGLPNKWSHQEGFVSMPDVIRKMLFDGKMDFLFAHAGNLSEATPEFLPVFQRLAPRFPHVKNEMERNPYFQMFLKSGRIPKLIKSLSLHRQMQVGIKHDFKGSTIGQILRHPHCEERTMLLALSTRKTREYMNEYSDLHHYFNIVHNLSTTKAVLEYIVKNIKHSRVVSAAQTRLEAMVPKKTKKSTLKFKKTSIKAKKFRTGSRAIVRNLA
ncbi:Uncharacterised protein [uncultured archaeon]|nr:Uncharacterised protein [uncultured archaeon]